LNRILKTSLYILVTAESICILTAETVDLVFYQYSLLLSIPLALFAGAFTVVVPEAYRKYREEENRICSSNYYSLLLSSFEKSNSKSC
jgi:amino acid permease